MRRTVVCLDDRHHSDHLHAAFNIYHSAQGSQGLLGAPSKQQLDTVFGTHRDDEVIEIILKGGREQASDGVSSGSGGLNVARSSFSIDTRGKGTSGTYTS